MSLTECKTAAELIQYAVDHAGVLAREREARGGVFPDDRRIATEISSIQYELGKMEKAILDQTQRMRDGIKRNDEAVRSLRAAYKQLQGEFDIATHRPKKRTKTTTTQP